MTNIKIAEDIKQRRLELNMTQAELAKRLKVSQNFVTYLEKGQRKPSNEMLQKLSIALALPLDKLFFSANPEVKKIVGFNDKKKAFEGHLPPALESLQKDSTLRKGYNISDGEIDQLASMRLRGVIRNKEDYLFLLMSIRQVLK